MDKQVFQTNSKSRWTKFKWVSSLIIFIFLIFIAIFITMLIVDKSPNLPFHEDFRSAVMAKKPYLKKNNLANEYEGYRGFFKEKKVHNNYEKWRTIRNERIRRYSGNLAKVTNEYISDWYNKPAGVRAAFYVTWDPQSFISLKQSIKSINLVIPEWFFIDPKTSEMTVKIDSKGYNLMKKVQIPIMPMLSNASGGIFNAAGIERILHNKHLRTKLINNVLKKCLENKFIGINVDFEELTDDNNEYLTTFIKELATAFHEHNLYVTQDISAFNEDYDVKQLAKYADYLFLMAYDEHNSLSDPGDLSSQQWIEKATDNLADKIQEEKIILCLASYGYDWTPAGDNNQSISYHEALSLASSSNTKIIFNEDTYGLSFAYTDDENVTHQVYFNDAATNYNAMRFGCHYGLGGFSLWRLGSEDNRLWSFYKHDLSKTGAARLNIGDLESLKGSKSTYYIGNGEVLDVIDTPSDGNADITLDNNLLIADEDYTVIPSAYQLQKFGRASNKELLLTFDDGPDEEWTPRILDILDKYKIHAAFFMVGMQMEKNLPIVNRVYNSGNIIGNHTFTHRNVAINSPDRTFIELKLTRLLLESITGNSTILFRAPYNADSDPSGYEEIIPLVEARKQNFLDVGESIDPEDWEPGVTSEQIYQRVMNGVKRGNGHIILLHDAGGNTRKPTIDALPRIIEDLQKEGYKFINLPEYLGRSKAQLMPPIPKGEEYYAMQANLALAKAIYNTGNFLAALFIVFLTLGIGRLTFMFFLTIRGRKRMMDLSDVIPENAPLVSIIVPAYNEEVNAVSSLQNLLKQDYPNFNVIFVDDGSKDATYSRVQEAFTGNPHMQILTKVNGGKASALNFGIAHTTADYVVCIDADTKLYPDAISYLMRHFFADKEEKIGAVAGNVKVGNKCNMLTRWQAIEYTTSQNFDRLAYSAINAITVVPGAIGAFRKCAIEKAGGLTTDTLAEDCDLTIRILRAGYIVANENRAIAMTEAPEKLKQFVKQRTRWSFGIIQTFWKHRDALFVAKNKGLGLWALPNMLIFQFIIPTFSPIADVLMILGLFSGNVLKVLLYYAVFLLVDASISIMAYIHEHEKLWVLLWIIPQRLAYRWIMYFVLFRSYKKAIKGELQTWGVLKRTGKVKDI